MRIEKWMDRVIMKNYVEYNYIEIMMWSGEFSRIRTLDRFLDLRI